MGVWKVLPALAAGCTVVLKPSELAPLSCLLLAGINTPVHTLLIHPISTPYEHAFSIHLLKPPFKSRHSITHITAFSACSRFPSLRCLPFVIHSPAEMLSEAGLPPGALNVVTGLGTFITHPLDLFLSQQYHNPPSSSTRMM